MGSRKQTANDGLWVCHASIANKLPERRVSYVPIASEDDRVAPKLPLVIAHHCEEVGKVSPRDFVCVVRQGALPNADGAANPKQAGRLVVRLFDWRHLSIRSGFSFGSAISVTASAAR